MSLLLKYGPGVLKLGALALTVVGAFNAMANRVDRLEDRTATISDDVQAMKRETTTRFEELNRQREQHAKDIALMNLRLDTLEKSLQRTEQNTLLVLDRLGRPAPRR